MIQSLIFFVLFGGTILHTFASSSTNSQIETTDWGSKIDQFQVWMENHSDDDVLDALQKFDLNKIAQWLNSQSQTKDQVANLEQQIKADELLVNKKRKALGDIQEKIDLLKLTPNQILAIEKYNHSIKQDPQLVSGFQKEAHGLKLEKTF